MIPSILAWQMQQGVKDFLKTTFPISAPFFHGLIDRLLDEGGGVFKGPYISIQLPIRIQFLGFPMKSEQMTYSLLVTLTKGYIDIETF